MAKLMGRTSLPDYAQLISHIGISKGGLGLLYASHCAAQDFVLTLTGAMRYMRKGIYLNPDIQPHRLHPTIADLFDSVTNPSSLVLQRYNAPPPTSPKSPAPHDALSTNA